ncbi:MAG: NUDIX domain-containing protein [Bacilli bacterium]
MPGGHIKSGETWQKATIREIKKEVNDIMWVDKNTILKLYFDNKFETTSFFWKAINFED